MYIICMFVIFPWEIIFVKFDEEGMMTMTDDDGTACSTIRMYVLRYG